MDNMIFAQSIGRIRYLETKMLDRSKIEALLDSKNFTDCKNMLVETVYGKYLNMPSYEDGLRLAIENLYKDMRAIVPVKEIINTLSVRYDAHNIKCIIKGIITGIDTDNLLIDAGTLSKIEMKSRIKEKNYKKMPDALKDCIIKAFSAYENTHDPQMIDITADCAAYKYMLEIAGKSGFDFMTDITKRMIDVINIKSFVRIKAQNRDIDVLEKAFIDGGYLKLELFTSFMNYSMDKFAAKIIYTEYSKWYEGGFKDYLTTNDIGYIEKYGDNYLLDYLKKAKFISFGPEPIVAYIIAIENEIKILRIILTGKKNDVSEDLIRERLRDIYV